MKITKKIVVTAAALLLAALQGVCAIAAQPDASAMNDRIYVRGQLASSEFSYGDSLTVLLQNESDNSIAYANEVDINADGSYSIAFPFADYSADNHKLTVTAGEVNVSDSTVYAGRFDDIVKTEFVKTEGGNHIKIFAEISNPYLLEQGYTLIAAAYTENSLKEAVLSEPQELSASENANAHLITLPTQDIDRVKLMIFEDTTMVEPLCKSFPIENISSLPVESSIFYDRYEVEDFEDKVGFSRVDTNGNSYLEKGEGKGYFAVNGIDLTTVKSCIINAGANVYGKTLDVRLGSRDGEKIGEVELPATKQTNIFTLSDFDLKTVENESATLYFVDNSEEAAIGVDFVMFTNDVSSKSSGAGAAKYVNSDSADVKYSSAASDAASNDFYYNSDAKVVSVNESVKYEFYGTGIDIIADITASDCEVEVYLDGILDKTINLKNRLNEGQAAYARPIYTKTGLKRWGHTIEIKTKNNGFTLDAFKVYTRPIRFVCAGDSITDGFRVTSGGNKTGKELSWPHRLNELLGNGYIVFNCGKGGTTTVTYKNADVHPFRTARLEDADIVSIMLGYNDVWGSDFEPSLFKERFVYVAEQIKELYTTEPRIYVAQVPFFSASNENGALERQPKFFESIKELSVENNWPFIDFNTYMKPYRDNTAYCIDKTHPNTVAAMWMMAEAIYGQLPCSELSDSAEITSRIAKRAAGIDPDAESQE